MNRRRTLALAAPALLVLVPRPAAAGNGTHPRTPVLWTDAPCMTVIDRSQSANFPLVYTIPFEDTDVTPDEVANSRTHQFFAFCRDHHREELLPSWIAEADLAAADAAGLGSADEVDPELEVLDLAPEWAGCFARINADDERRPITFAAAADPVPWDLATLPAGPWVVEGYTYEPWANEWWPRPGVFKIVDDPDPAATPPAAALSFAEQIVEFGGEATITGCVDAMPGTTFTASYAISGFGSAPDWQPIMVDVPASAGTFELSFAPPMETISNQLLIKIDVVDPEGRTWTAHGDNYIAVTEDLGGDDCNDGGGGGFIGCETDAGDSETDTGAGSGSGEGSTEDSADATSGLGATDSDGGGCNCSTQATPTELPWRGLGLALGLLVAWRRRLSSRRAA